MGNKYFSKFCTWIEFELSWNPSNVCTGIALSLIEFCLQNLCTCVALNLIWINNSNKMFLYMYNLFAAMALNNMHNLIFLLATPSYNNVTMAYTASNISIRTHARTHARTHTHTHIHTYIGMHTHTYKHHYGMCVYVCRWFSLCHLRCLRCFYV